ncbi:MAG: 50S ribosomal protein L4 [Candidatus Uhrbacteria bacterium]
MASVPVYNATGQQTGELELAPELFDVRPKPSVMRQVVTAQQVSARQPLAHTKTRGEVRGGGKKPWSQKGTGRARHGSIRSPIWVGGGTTFGPRSIRNYVQKVNTRMRRQALRMALTDKVTSGRFIVLEDFDPAQGKAKAAKELIGIAIQRAEVGAKQAPSVLVALPTARRAAAQSIRNFPRVRGIDAEHLNVVDVLRSDILLTTRVGYDRMVARFRDGDSQQKVEQKV